MRSPPRSNTPRAMKGSLSPTTFEASCSRPSSTCRRTQTEAATMQHEAATMPGEILSPSQASTFLSCSARWRFKYLLGLKDPAGGGAARGRAVHLAIEYYMRAKMAGVVLDPEKLTDEWDGIWDS